MGLCLRTLRVAQSHAFGAGSRKHNFRLNLRNFLEVAGTVDFFARYLFLNGKRVESGLGMKKITTEEVLHLADLAGLKLNREQAEKTAVQLDMVFRHFETLNEVRTPDEISFRGGTSAGQHLRRDISGVSLSRERALGNAPERREDFFVVPRVI